MEKKFIADVHLGKLARLLRLLGIDTAYRNDYTTDDLKQIARSENRVLLSRNPAFKTIPDEIDAFILKSEDPERQLRTIVKYYDLKDDIAPFSRCMMCNGKLESRRKEQVLNKLEPNTVSYFNQFWQCTECERIYWEGSHYGRMSKWINKLKTEIG